MTLQTDLTFAEKYLPAIKKVLKVVAVGLIGVTIWKGVHGFFPTLGLLGGVAFYVIADLL